MNVFKEAYEKQAGPLVAGVSLLLAIMGTAWLVLEIAGVDGSPSLLLVLSIGSILLAANATTLAYLLRERRVVGPARLNDLRESYESGDYWSLERHSIEDLDYFRRQTQSAGRLRIFASGSEHYHSRLEAVLAGMPRILPLRIEVLVRHDGSDYRQTKIEEAARRWELLDQKFGTSTRLATYQFETMWRGFIWDDDRACVGWYERVSGVTRGQEEPMVAVDSDSPFGRRVVDLLGRSFDRMFERTLAGQQLVVFDLDGTLYRNSAVSAGFDTASVEALGASLGVPRAEAVTRLESERGKGGKRRSKLEVLLELGVERGAFEVEQLRHVPFDVLQEDADLVNALARLRRVSRVALLTNVMREPAVRLLGRLGLTFDCFDFVLTGSELDVAKPSIEDLADLSMSLGIPARYVTVVGDRQQVDLKPTLELGMAGLLVDGPEDVIAWIQARTASSE